MCKISTETLRAFKNDHKNHHVMEPFISLYNYNFPHQ